MAKSKITVIKDWLKILVLLLDEAIVIGVVIVLIRVFNIEIPLPVYIIGGVVLAVLIFLVHRAIIPSFHRKQVVGVEGMVGGEGEVVESLDPKGVIRIKGEYWKAKSVDGSIDVGEPVEIKKVSGLVLEVMKKVHG